MHDREGIWGRTGINGKSDGDRKTQNRSFRVERRSECERDERGKGTDDEAGRGVFGLDCKVKKSTLGRVGVDLKRILRGTT